ncbi:MAG: P22 coat protein - protein 5 domain protein [Smithella sp.]
MGLENFIPAIWSAKLDARLRKNLAFADLVNTDYQGEITSFGDRVKINEIGTISVGDYVKNSEITFQELDGAQKELIIDQARYFAFKIDDIDTAQQNPKVMNAAMSEASYAIADGIDQFIAKLYSSAGIKNDTYLGNATTAISVTSGNIISTISYASRFMDENNVPSGNRFIVVPPWVHQKLLLAEVGGISATAVPKVFDDGALTAGYVGDALGFRIILSNNVQNAATNVSAIMAFNRTAISYAGQISKVEATKIEKGFGEGVKGLYVFGAKVVHPESLATLYLTEAAG